MNPPLSATDALRSLANRTYCLWVGAGLSTHLGLAGGRLIPGWSKLIEIMEAAANLQPPYDIDFPDRLEACLRTLGRRRFQRLLREHVLVALASAIVEAKVAHGETVPSQVKQIAQLGCMANPCVNFNIEILTSQALLSAWSPWRPLVFTAPIPDAVTSPLTSSGSTSPGVAQRNIYHPMAR
jgi:hypothetical protein